MCMTLGCFTEVEPYLALRRKHKLPELSSSVVGCNSESMTDFDEMESKETDTAFATHSGTPCCETPEAETRSFNYPESTLTSSSRRRPTASTCTGERCSKLALSTPA